MEVSLVLAVLAVIPIHEIMDMRYTPNGVLAVFVGSWGLIWGAASVIV